MVEINAAIRELADDLVTGLDIDGKAVHRLFVLEDGDPNAPMAAQVRFSTPDKPPRVESGEMLINHESGNKLIFDKDKAITLTHYAQGGTISFDQNGTLTFDTKGQPDMVKTGGGSMTVDTGGGVLSIV